MSSFKLYPKERRPTKSLGKKEIAIGFVKPNNWTE